MICERMMGCVGRGVDLSLTFYCAGGKKHEGMRQKASRGRGPRREGRTRRRAAGCDAEESSGPSSTSADPSASVGSRSKLKFKRKGDIVCVADPVVGYDGRSSGGGGGRHAPGGLYVADASGKILRVKGKDVRGPLRVGLGWASDIMLPHNFPGSVTSDYVAFSWWQVVRNIASNATAVLATHALLRAVGIGGGAAVGMSATLNWVLKDGLGRVGCIAFAAVIGNRFDEDPKSFFLVGDVVYELGIGIEMLTPLCPGYFLAVASLANALKSVSYMMRLPPRAAILKSFARANNVGDVSAKANSQEVAASLLGTLVGIVIASFTGDNMRIGMLWYVVSVLLCGIATYRSLTQLELPTLNWQRTYLLARAYVSSGGARVGDPGEVNREEAVPRLSNKHRLPTSLSRRGSSSARGRGGLTFVHPAPLDITARTVAGLHELANLYVDNGYLLNYFPEERRVAVTLKEGAGQEAVLQAVLQATYLSHAVEAGEERGEPVAQGGQQQLLKDSYEAAVSGVDDFLSKLEAAGWDMNVMWNNDANRVVWGLSSSLISEPAIPGVNIEPDRVD